MLPLAAVANTVGHWSSGTTTLTIASNGTLSATHPTYSGSYSGFTVFNYYACNTQPNFATDASRQFSTPSTGNGNGDWALVVGGVSSLNADVSIGGGTGCRILGTQFSGPLSASHDGKYVMAASRTGITSGGNTTYYYVFSNATQYNHAFGSVVSATVSSDGRRLTLTTSNSQSGSSGLAAEFAVTANGSAVPLDSISRSGSEIRLSLAQTIGAGVTVTVAKVSNVWTAYNIPVFSAIAVTNGSTVTGGSSSAAGAGSAPIKYSGPEFTGLSLKPALVGTSTTLEGRKLNEISTITVDGKAQSFLMQPTSH